MSNNFDDFDPFDDFDDDGASYGDSTDDDILDDFDDGGKNDPSAMSQEQIMARVDAYREETEKNIEIATKPRTYPDANMRRDAVRWLGESGNPEAIPALLLVYKKDKTPGMKDEAAYALGQFKALEMAYDDPEVQTEAEERVNQIILSGEVGKRPSMAQFFAIEGGLAVLAVILLVVGGVLFATVGQERRDARALAVAQTQTAMPTPTQDTREAVNGELQRYYDQLSADADFFRVQLAVSTRAVEDIECELDTFLVRPSAYTLSPAWEGDTTLTGLVGELNAVRETLQPVYTAYREACALTTNTIPRIPRDEALGYAETVLDAQGTLQTINTNLNEAGIEVTEQVFSTPVPEETEPADTGDTADGAESTAEAETSTDNDGPDISLPIIDLERLIDQMTELGGPTSDINFYWDQVVTNEAIYRSGCNQPQPLIPADYTLDAEYAGLSTDLESAVQSVNSGLQQTRLAVSAFYTACELGEVPEDAQARFEQTELAIFAFETATETLDGIDQ